MHTDECPTGITTHNPHLIRGLVVSAKARRVANFQQETIKAALELLAGMGLDSFVIFGGTTSRCATAADR